MSDTYHDTEEQNVEQERRDAQRQLKVWGRKERALPPQGCSIAFFVFLGLLVVILAVKYIQYRNS